jgi:4'-phosphopantetheinyl transferase
MVEIDAVNLATPIPPETFRRWLAFVGPERREAIARFRFVEDAQRSLVADLLARTVIGRRLGRTNDEIIFVREPNRKPRLKEAGGFEFNLSHSGDWVVCASGFGPVGADVEKIRDFEWDDLKDTLSADEQGQIDPVSRKDWRTVFAAHWTIKESYLKALGEGLSIPPSELSAGIEAGAVRLSRNGRPIRGVFIRTYAPDPEHRAAVCSLRETPPAIWTIRTVDEICRPCDRI